MARVILESSEAGRSERQQLETLKPDRIKYDIHIPLMRSAVDAREFNTLHTLYEFGAESEFERVTCNVEQVVVMRERNAHLPTWR